MAAESKRKKFVPTHEHNEGGKYRVIGQPSIQIEGKWFRGVMYCDKDGNEYVRTEDTFNARFSKIFYHEPLPKIARARGSKK